MVCQDCKSFLRSSEAEILLNVSGFSIYDDDFVDKLFDPRRKNRINPASIIFAITGGIQLIA